jgi:hypothetical protein
VGEVAMGGEVVVATAGAAATDPNGQSSPQRVEVLLCGHQENLLIVADPLEGQAEAGA